MKQPYRGMTRLFWQKGRFAKVAEEVHAVYLLEKWTKMEARNQKRFISAAGGLTVVELERLGTKPKEALPQRYGAEMFEALKHGSVRRIVTGETLWYGQRGFGRCGTTTKWRRRCSS